MGKKHLKLLTFAVLMSCSTALLVSAAILFINGASDNFFTSWLKSVLLAWPLVFLSILTLAPLINRFIEKIIKDD